MAKLPLLAILVGTLTASAAGASQTAPATSQPPPACGAPEHRQFDFWVGRWDVYRGGTETLAGRSLIERLYDGCVIRENWMPVRGAGGTSVNNYDPGEQRWHQTWVSGANARVEFHGGLVENKMVLTGFWPNSAGPAKHGLIRMTYTPLPDGSVRQFGELSVDHGMTWQTAFDFTYRKQRQP